MYEKLKTAAEAIQKQISKTPKIGIILGSGLGAFVERIENKTIIPYDEIPFFGRTTVEGHEGRLISGELAGVPIVVMQGRYHCYEGLPMDEVVFPTRVLATLGIDALLLTNAAGGINLNYTPGDLICISDHINLMGKNPLVGPNMNEWGPRFPDMTHAYNLELQNILVQSAKKVGFEMKKGVYAGVLGPTYETPAEIKMLRTIGADMVGMSTVPESIAANHFGIQVCGVSCITNMAAGIENKKLDHSEVKEQAIKVMETFSNLLGETIKTIGSRD